jgi:uncharacterized protein (TIGR03066 family)
MNTLRLALICCLVFAAAGQAQKGKKEGKKIDKAKLVGTWTFVKGSDKDLFRPGLKYTLTFTKAGDFKEHFAAVGTKGTYKVEGDKLELTYKGRDGGASTATKTIKELTDKKLVIEEKDLRPGKEGKTLTVEFKK